MKILSVGSKLPEILYIDELFCSDCDSRIMIDYEFSRISEIQFTCYNCLVINYRTIGVHVANV